MQQEYINDELKKGNADVRVRVKPIDMLPPVDEADAVSAMDRRKDRSKSKSKSPKSRLRRDDSQRKLSRFEVQSDGTSQKKLGRDPSQPRLQNYSMGVDDYYTNDQSQMGGGLYAPDTREKILY